jgi:hypothetical protein
MCFHAYIERRGHEMTRKMQVRLVAALTLAEAEIHNPGAARYRNIDIAALISGVLREAKAADPMMNVVREEILKMEAA